MKELSRFRPDCLLVRLIGGKLVCPENDTWIRLLCTCPVNHIFKIYCGYENITACSPTGEDLVCVCAI